ncbi:uncharacterized protein LOC141601639 [Silene latifolia]|uniref:uncharacterized protein LOC141601639 n=1 Tax=Silene latifolia TaxID=37657 RepID=UPI003D7872EC
MRCVAWNIRGIGSRGKFTAIKKLIADKQLHVCGLVETKHKSSVERSVRSWWSNINVDLLEVKSVDRGSGLILMWDADSLKNASGVCGERWILVCGMFGEKKIPCSIILVYGPCNVDGRRKVLEELFNMRRLFINPVLVFGDFNEVLQPGERLNHDDRSVGMVNFEDWVENMELLVLPLLERVDHYPLLVECDKALMGKRPFRCLDAWSNCRGFKELIQKEWNRELENFHGDEVLIARRKALFSSLQLWLTRKERLYRKDSVGVESIEALPFASLSEEQRVWIESIPLDEEIKAAVWSCNSAKAPGFDGFNFHFIKHHWITIGDDFILSVRRFFEEGRCPDELNITWVTLIPKVECAVELSDFRPISMVGCVYKVISKILAERLRSLLPGLIGETQSAFVQQRQILDGALIANEVVHWIKKSKGSGVLLKLDFHKAYHSIRWETILAILKAMGFGVRWRKWIFECV